MVDLFPNTQTEQARRRGHQDCLEQLWSKEFDRADLEPQLGRGTVPQILSIYLAVATLQGGPTPILSRGTPSRRSLSIYLTDCTAWQARRRYGDVTFLLRWSAYPTSSRESAHQPATVLHLDAEDGEHGKFIWHFSMFVTKPDARPGERNTCSTDFMQSRL